MLQFVPLSDQDLELDPAVYSALVPFNLDYPCRRLAYELPVTTAVALPAPHKLSPNTGDRDE
jgi:hypothetical protein